jgi:hypothetical protein
MSLGQSEILGELFFFIIAAILFALSFLAAALGITMIGCSEMEGQRLSWQQALRRTFSIRLFRLFVQITLECLALYGLFILLVDFLSLGLAAESGMARLAGAVTGALVIVAAIYLWVKWAFAVVAIAWEDAGIFQSFGRSFSLVRGIWWRTFGILVLLYLIAQFAISIITTPVTFILQRAFLSNYYSSWINIGVDEISPDVHYHIFQWVGFGVGIGAGIWISIIIILLIIPLITVVMYFDLKARNQAKNQLNAVSSESE